jgi:hypothetical protein
MVHTKKPNSTIDSSSIKLSKEYEIVDSSFNFKQMETVEF